MRRMWNRPDWPVWSVSSIDRDGISNMNIATYVQAVSLQPKLMLVALYKGTKTFTNVQESRHCLLQLLSRDLAPSVRICGKQSGNERPKIDRLEKRFEIDYHAGLPFFVDVCGYLELSITNWHEVGGDHVLATGEVVQHKNLHDVPILTTDYLKEHKYIR